MGLHKLEIELTDELLSRIDAVSAETRHSREEVVVETLKDRFPERKGLGQTTIEERLAAFERISEMVSKLGPGRSKEEIDRELEEFRADRQYDW